MGKNKYFILKHGVGHMPNRTEVDVPLTYGDYYFIEAITRYKKMNGVDSQTAKNKPNDGSIRGKALVDCKNCSGY